MKISRKCNKTDKQKAASRKGKLSKRKGNLFEKEIEKSFNAAFAKNNIKADARRGFKSEIDVEILESSGRLLLNIETKCGKHVQIRKAYKQAKSKQRAASRPLVVWKDDHGELMAAMSLDLLLDFVCTYLMEEK
jgi:hypothetical protein